MMSLPDCGVHERIGGFLRKSLLGEELINTRFHVFSARSIAPSQLTKPRVLCANNALLAKSSKYFLDLLSSDVNPSDESLSDLTDANEVPSHGKIEDYGYGSDSDLEDDSKYVPVDDTEAPKDGFGTMSTERPQISLLIQPENDDELSEDGSESVSSDVFVMSPEHPIIDSPFDNIGIIEAAPVTSGKPAVQEGPGDRASTSKTTVCLRSLGSRHILIKDTAFQTWYTLLNYLYTNSVTFLPLRSATPRGQPCGSSTGSLDEPRCSAKSMYRLACKVGLDHLRDEALAHVWSNLTEHNILKELSCSIVTGHADLLEMELDVLYAHIGSAPVVAGFPEFARRIARKELPHGADIIIGIHSRLLAEGQPSLPMPRPPSVPPPISPPTFAGVEPLPLSEAAPPTSAVIELASLDGVPPSFRFSPAVTGIEPLPPTQQEANPCGDLFEEPSELRKGKKSGGGKKLKKK